MKRWRDRGEVQDSDEEDLDFSNDSQGAEQSPKRPRLDVRQKNNGQDEPVSGGGYPGHGEDEAEGLWLRPRTVATHGRKETALRRETLGVLKPQHGNTRPDLIASDYERTIRQITASDDEHPSAAERPADATSIWEASPPRADDRHYMVDPTNDDQALRNGVSVDGRPVLAMSPQSSEGEELPSLSQLVSGKPERRPRTPEVNLLSDSSTLSSPLSSPEAPPFLLHFGMPPTVRTGQLTSRQDGEGTVNAALSVNPELATALQIGDAVSAATRRSLRARTEKQLHPYIYDRTLYQQQWRQRGLRPVEFVTRDRTQHETQDQSYDTDESESQNHVQNSSFPTQAGHELHEETVRENHIPPADTDHPPSYEKDAIVSHRIADGPQGGRKRRRLSRLNLFGEHTSRHSRDLSGRGISPPHQNESPGPLSPPLTSSSSVRADRQGRLPSGFKLPPGFKLPSGMAPAPLQTPQISSDVRPSYTVGSGRDSASPPRRARTSTLTRAHSRVVTIDSSSESSAENCSKSGADERRLRRERKRIRGVLPASWLKIDLRAQQRNLSPSPPRTRRQSTASPPQSIHAHKGIAQKVSRKPTTPSRSNVIDISDDEDNSDDSLVLQPPQSFRQSRLNFERDSPNAGNDDFADDEGMEVDWIDHMWPTSTRQAQERSLRKKRQPKITDTFQKIRDRGLDLSEDRAGLRRAGGTMGGKKRTKQRSNMHRRQNNPRQSAPALSILDAPVSASGPTLPQFVRLARRQARRQPEKARHSPSRKVVRLATKDDTDEALVLLNAWREGTIPPQPLPEQQLGPPSATYASAGEVDAGSEFTSQHARGQLRETINGQQPRQRQLPSPHRKEANSTSRTASRISVRKPQRRQTRLQPVVIDHGNRDVQGVHPVDPTIPESGALNTGQTRELRFLVQPQDSRFRSAQLEMLEDSFDQGHRATAFERRMNILTESVARPPRQSRPQTLPLERFLADRDDSLHMREPTHLVSARRHQGVAATGTEDHEPTRQEPNLPIRRRKFQARRIDVEAREYRQPSEPLPEGTTVDDIPVNALNNVTKTTESVLQGLGPFGTRYATDFDIRPLTIGTYFHESTFIGSGEFEAALKFADRDLSLVAGRMQVHVNGEVLEWAAWTEDLAAGIARIPRTISESIQTLNGLDAQTGYEEQLAVVTSNIDHMLRSIVRYFSRCLVFMDPVDRRSCVQSLQRFIDDLSESLLDTSIAQGAPANLLRRCWQYALVITTQASLLSDDKIIDSEITRRSRDRTASVAANLATEVFPASLNDLRIFYEANTHSAKRDAGIRDEDTTISSMVILRHCLCKASSTTFWATILSILGADARTLSVVSNLDRHWYNVYTILPALEVDVAGIARPGIRLHKTETDWTVIKPCVDRLFQLYPATSTMPGTTINDYVRATLIRCYRLQTRWGWWTSEGILSTIFDFFARRNLASLHNEESHGAPKFLSELEGQPSIEIQPEDVSFHMFLKLVATCLQGLQKYGIYSDKKIGSIAWRFIPNHGRTYRKDADVSQADIDALRNHHDLLCTLYYASPSGHRIRLGLLRNLVDHSTSHREACRISVRAWSNLASFQASTSDHEATLQPFTEWYRDILRTTIAQYRLAKTEAESDFATAKAQGITGITDGLLNSTIASNQRQIAATLADALAGLKRALTSASSLSKAFALVEGSAFWRTFVPFDPSEKRLYTGLEEALEVVKAALGVQRKFCSSLDSQQASEASQEYGDSSALLQLAATQGVAAPSKENITHLLHEPTGQLISNIFGADQTVDEHLLTKAIDTWVSLAKECVRSGTKSWASFFDEYSSHSWRQLRDTEQKRKYTPYFLARLIEEADGDLVDIQTEALVGWLISLVEREAMLRYQHMLTTALLNHIHDEPLLSNLPFSEDIKSGRYSISMFELRQRRLALISSVLSNMRDHFDEVTHFYPQRLQECRRTYVDILRALMQAMKTNYQELQSGMDVRSADPTVQGAYVNFVQQVVSFLQEHTADICRIDAFFTDSAAFPLPATDPTYVVGRLRRYVPKLAESKTRKQLIVFIHTASERAAVDSQQQYLVNQLCSAMDGAVERGSRAVPSLRHVILTAIFPAYIKAALSTTCSWILVLPVLEACGRIVSSLLYDIILEDGDSVKAVMEMIEAIVDSLHEPFKVVIMQPACLRQSHVQRILSLVLGTGQSLLTVCDYLTRSLGRGAHAIQSLNNMRTFAIEIRTQLASAEDRGFTEMPGHCVSSAQEPWPETKAFAQKQIQESLERDWYANDGQYFVRRGNTSKEVVVSLSDDGEEREVLCVAAVRFIGSFDMVMDGQGQKRRAARKRSYGLGGVIV